MTLTRSMPTWRAVDATGRDVATGRAPEALGAPSPAAALAAAPVASWPMSVMSGDGRHLRVAEALGPGGEGVERLLDRLVAAGPSGPAPAALTDRLAHTPAGPVQTPAARLPLAEAVELAARVDRRWLAAVDERRHEPRAGLEAGGRGADLEAALHVTMLLATERLDPADDEDLPAHVASGAQLWLLGGAVAWALAGAEPNPFLPWAELVTEGWWPVGPCEGRLVVTAVPGRGRVGTAGAA